MRRLALLAMALIGAVLLLLGWRGAGQWASRGTIVAEQSVMVPGAPPWSLTLAVPEAARDYLLESTVVVDSPADRSDVTAAPQLRATAIGEGGPAEVRPAEAARTILGRTVTTVVTHAWLRVGAPGEHKVELINLQLSPVDLQPHQWRVRLAEGVPDQPAGMGWAGGGFVLLALALVGWLLCQAKPATVG